MKYVNYSKVVSHFSKRFYEIAKKIGMSLLVILGMTIESSATIPRETNTSGILDEIDLLEITLPPPTEQYPIPPMPDVWIEGRWVTWEEAYGPIQVYRAASALNQGVSPFQLQTSQSQTSSASSQFSTYAQIMASLTLADCDQNKINILKRRAALNLPAPVVPRESMLELQTNSLQSLTNNVIPASTEDGTNSIKLHFVGFTYDEANGNCGYSLLVEGIHTNQVIEVYHTPDMASGQWYGIDVIERIDFANNVSGIIVSTEGLGFLNRNFFCAFVLQDTDLDGLSDGMEMMIFKSDPNNPDSAILRDQNGDGVPDHANAANNWICDGDEDLDNDGWTNAEELAMGTNPFVKDDNEIDSDNDGLPDWAEDQIRIYCGVQNPTPFEDSDGDNVNNYTELLLGTNPSHASLQDYIYYNPWVSHDFAVIASNVFVLPSIIKQNVTTNSSISDIIRFDLFNMYGVYSSVEITRDAVSTNEVSCDKIDISIANLSLTNLNYWNCLDLTLNTNKQHLNAYELGKGYISTESLLGTTTKILDTVWTEPGVSTAINTLSDSNAYLLRDRCIGRISVLMKELHILCYTHGVESDGLYQSMDVVTRMKMDSLIRNIISEKVLYNHLLAKLEGLPIGTWMKCLLSGSTHLVSIVNVVNISSSFDESFNHYLSSIRQFRDEAGFNTLHFAGEFANLLVNASAIFSPNFSAPTLEIIFSHFKGYGDK